MEGDEQVEPSNPAEFLLALTESLKVQQGVDADLLGVLTEHVLVDMPKESCVADARAQIIKLAEQRAAPAAVAADA